ncbi:hypothetical protein ACFYOV_15105 [Streptomyces sp. NPDC005931]|uniref:hypothetical protein n=1 Tax=Streptomyces sp. NPDC005931 TaxID=3364737 RepID=UPI0036A27EA0
MDVLFYGVPGLMTALACFMAYRVVRRWQQIRAAWNSGLTAEGRCVRVFTSTRGGGNDTSVRTVLHHVYEFLTHDGRVIRFEEEGGRATVIEGDHVTVYYTGGPRVAATAQAPSPVRHNLTAFGVLTFIAVLVLFCVGFIVGFHEVRSAVEFPG